MNSKQLSLFEPVKNYQFNNSNSNLISKQVLSKWKQKIKYYQQQIKGYKLEQNFLFDNHVSGYKPDEIDPFELKTYCDQFYDLPEFNSSQTCLYFILDLNFPLLLYVGETKLSPQQRWQNHDCKMYIQKYIELHRRYHLPVTIRSAFWWGMPSQRKLRQNLEQQLILRWRSPFNKECWQWWGQPFSGENKK